MTASILPFRDPSADLQGDELETALAAARAVADDAAAAGLWETVRRLGRTPGCERLGVDNLMVIARAAMRRQLRQMSGR